MTRYYVDNATNRKLKRVGKIVKRKSSRSTRKSSRSTRKSSRSTRKSSRSTRKSSRSRSRKQAPLRMSFDDESMVPYEKEFRIIIQKRLEPVLTAIEPGYEIVIRVRKEQLYMMVFGKNHMDQSLDGKPLEETDNIHLAIGFPVTEYIAIGGLVSVPTIEPGFPPDVMEMSHIQTGGQYRGRGIGKILLDIACTIIRIMGKQVLIVKDFARSGYVSANDEEEKTRGWYIKQGFSVYDIDRKEYMGKWRRFRDAMFKRYPSSQYIPFIGNLLDTYSGPYLFKRC